MRIRLQANPIQLSREKILANVAEGYVQAIKDLMNPMPYMKAWVFAQEGNSYPENSLGLSVIEIPKTGVQAMFERMKTGTKFFDRHYETDPNESRIQAGKVVGKFTDTIEGKLSAIAIGYFDEENIPLAEDSPYVSVEADFGIDRDPNDKNKGILKTVEAIDAIALLRKEQSPGVPGAKELAAIRASEELKDKKVKPMEFHEFEAEFRRLKIFPSQLEKPSDAIGELAYDESGNPILNGKDKEYAQHVTGIIQKISTKITDAKDKEIAELKKQNVELGKKAYAADAKPKLLEAAKKQNLGDQFIAFVEKRSAALQIGEDLDKSIEEFVTAKKEDFVAAVGDKTKEKVKPGDPGKTEYDEDFDPTDPEHNELLDPVPGK